MPNANIYQLNLLILFKMSRKLFVFFFCFRYMQDVHLYNSQCQLKISLFTYLGLPYSTSIYDCKPELTAHTSYGTAKLSSDISFTLRNKQGYIL